MLKHFIDKKFLNFVIVGGLATAIQFGLLAFFIEVFKFSEVFSSALSYALSAVCNYLLNYYFTFASNSRHSETFAKFVLVVAIGLCINTIVFALCFFIFPYYLFAQLVATSTTLVVNFLLHKFWIYRSPL